MNDPLNSRRLLVLVAVSATLMLASCAKKENQAAAPAPSAAPASPTAPTPPAATPPAPVASTSPMAMDSPNGKSMLSAEAQKLGIKPENATTCPTEAPVKGNITKKRGELYFTTKFPDYKAVKPEICFKDTATAEKAGFRAPKAQ